MNKLKLSLANWLIDLVVALRRNTRHDYSPSDSPSILVTTWLPSGQTSVAYGEAFSSGDDILRVVQKYAHHKDLCNIVVQFPKAAHK